MSPEKRCQPIPLTSVILDCEGVVLDTEPLWDHGQEEFLARYGYTYDRASTKPLLTGRSLQESTAVLQQLYHLPGTVTDLAAERQRIMYSCLTSDLRFVPGALAFLDGLPPACTGALATAMDPLLFHTADAILDISAHFDVVITIDQVNGVGKPAPDLFLRAAAELRVPPGSCLVIEDAPHGVTAAQAAGMYTVALLTTHSAHELKDADLLVSDFYELAGALATRRPGPAGTDADARRRPQSAPPVGITTARRPGVGEH